MLLVQDYLGIPDILEGGIEETGEH